MKTKIFIVFVLLVLLQSCGTALLVNADYPELNEAVKNDPNNPVSFFNLGLKYYSDKNFEEAIKNFDLAIERDYNFSLAYFGKYCSLVLSDPELKNEMYKEDDEIKDGYLEKVKFLKHNYALAFMFDPLFDYRMATLLLEKRRGGRNIYTSELYDLFYKLFADGFRSYMLGNYKEAEEELTYSISKIPGYEDSYFVRALARAQINDFDGCISDLDTLINWNRQANTEDLSQIYYKSSDFYYIRGTVNLRQNKIKEAKSDFESCLMEDMGYYVAHSQLSNIYQKQKQYNEALRELDAAIFISPEDPQLHYNKGVFLAMVGQNEKAIESYKEVVKLNKYHFKAEYNLAYLCEKIGKNNDAKTYYQMFTENAPISQQKMIDDIKQKLASWE